MYYSIQDFIKNGIADLEEYNTIPENSINRRAFWRIKDRAKKHLLTSVGMIGFTHTRFEHKEKIYTGRFIIREDLLPHPNKINQIYGEANIPE